MVVLLVLGNSEPVTIQFLFWRWSFELYKVILASAFLGIILTIIYTGHWREIIRVRTDDWRRRP